jgi:hypothetical protein
MIAASSRGPYKVIRINFAGWGIEIIDVDSSVDRIENSHNLVDKWAAVMDRGSNHG